jgi:hypothetical protein
MQAGKKDAPIKPFGSGGPVGNFAFPEEGFEPESEALSSPWRASGGPSDIQATLRARIRLIVEEVSIPFAPKKVPVADDIVFGAIR